MSLVLDASVTLSWCFEDETCERSEAALDAVAQGGAHVPSLWTFEVLNVLLVGERRGRLTGAQSLRFLDRVLALPIQVHPPLAHPSAVKTLSLARTHSLTAYDAAYLELALRLDIPLATRDERLTNAARLSGTRIF